jgi:hypothetical protein
MTRRGDERVELDGLMLIVTGSTLSAERFDRPSAYWLRDRIGESLARAAPGRSVLVCSDLWYMNHDELRVLPTISIGPPAQNALAAFLADKLPTLYAVDGRFLVQGDPDGFEPMVSCWGRDSDLTRHAVARFAESHLAGFLERSVEPEA